MRNRAGSQATAVCGEIYSGTLQPELLKISGFAAGVECSRAWIPLATQDRLFTPARNLQPPDRTSTWRARAAAALARHLLRDKRHPCPAVHPPRSRWPTRRPPNSGLRPRPRRCRAVLASSTVAGDIRSRVVTADTRAPRRGNHQRADRAGRRRLGRASPRVIHIRRAERAPSRLPAAPGALAREALRACRSGVSSSDPLATGLRFARRSRARSWPVPPAACR